MQTTKEQKKYTMAHRMPEGKPVPTELIAESIREISRGMKALRNGSLNERAILVLLKASSNVHMVEIEKVLHAMRELERDYLQEKKQ
jgi:hypothetical protein